MATMAQIERPLPSTGLRRRAPGVARIASFFLLLALLAIAFDRTIDFGLRRIGTGEFGVWNRIVKGNINADIVISGSSRALTHYDSRVIEQRTGRTTFNIGLNGSQTDMQLARLKTYLAHNRKPLLLIHNLDLFSFETTHGGVYDPGQFQPYLNEPAIYDALAQIDPDIWKAKYLPLYGYAVVDLRLTWTLGLRAAFGFTPREDRYDGFAPRDAHWSEDFDRFKATHPGGVRFESEPEGIRAMRKLLDLCRQNGIRLLLVYSPEFIEMQRITTNREEIFARFAQLATESGAMVWDYSHSSISLHRENFYNSQHLNARGAFAFSDDLGRRLARDSAVQALRRARAERVATP
jgi:hypothetical protein